jgi:hypothetical protein
MFTTPVTQLYKSQYDILFESTEPNTYLTASSRASKNKALKTSDKRIIAAINELKSSIDSLSATTISTINKQNGIIGNISGDPELYAAFSAMGYDSIADGLIKINTKVGKNEKQIVFVFPKINQSTVFPEIFIPYGIHITSATARFSTVDNDLESITSDIKIGLRHTNNDDPTDFQLFKELTIPIGSSTITEEFEEDLQSGIIKASFIEYPDGLKNVNIVITCTKIVENEGD